MQQGQILRTRYQIIKFLGRGGFGETHLAHVRKSQMCG